MSNLITIKHPFIIAGPCSAETEEQVIETALRLKAGGKIDLLRAGIWKPRTRPNSFEGVGEIGLPWLINAGKRTDLPVITEVANAKHVEATLKAGFTHLWIGARTTVNPFAVQEIADALRGTDTKVWVKNPINPDLNLWIGGIERLKNAGLAEVNAIHRGFSSAQHKTYRNDPMWEIPMALKTEFPTIQLICDPSHITGKRELLQPVAQKAMDLIYDGLMLESHINPAEAWSDAAQQVTPERFTEIISELILRSENTSEGSLNEDLKTLRDSIDKIDEEITALIAQRMQIAEEIGTYKKEHHITILQPKRWEVIKNRQLSYGQEKGLSIKFLTKYLEALHQESIRHQTAVMNK